MVIDPHSMMSARAGRDATEDVRIVIGRLCNSVQALTISLRKLTVLQQTIIMQGTSSKQWTRTVLSLVAQFTDA